MTPILSAEAAEAAKAPPVRSRMEKWLFPLEQDLIEMSAPTESLVWYDDTLNEEQRVRLVSLYGVSRFQADPAPLRARSTPSWLLFLGKSLPRTPC